MDMLHAKSGLAKLFGEGGGQVPQESEIKLLQEVFGRELTKTVLAKRTLGQKLKGGAAEALNLPRSIMASFDLSAPLRQGIFLVGRPKQWLPAFGGMFKQFASERAFQEVQSSITKRPTYPVMRDARLALTEIGDSLIEREEQFMSRLGEKIPVVKYGVRASNRAYVGFLNKLRADVFDDLYAKGKAIGKEDNRAFVEDLGKFVNAATGRGPLGVFENSATVMNSIFFSPRLMASRLSLLNPLFFWGGFQQPIVAAYRLMSGQAVSSTSGREFTLGEGYKPTTRLDIAQRFLESKEAPIMSLVTALLKGKNAVGEDVRLAPEIVDRFIPMVVSDVHDVIQSEGIGKAWQAAPAVFGVGVQSYGDQIPQLTKTPAAARQFPSGNSRLLGKR